LIDRHMLRFTLTPALSRKRERGRVAPSTSRRAVLAVANRAHNPFSRLLEKVAAKRPDEGWP